MSLTLQPVHVPDPPCGLTVGLKASSLKLLLCKSGQVENPKGLGDGGGEVLFPMERYLEQVTA